MVHAKELPVRMQILQLIEEANPPCRRLFVDYQGLPIIWSWMVDCTPEQDELKIQVWWTILNFVSMCNGKTSVDLSITSFLFSSSSYLPSIYSVLEPFVVPPYLLAVLIAAQVISIFVLLQILKTLSALPITNRTILVDSKILSVVEQWAFAVDQKTQR